MVLPSLVLVPFPGFNNSPVKDDEIGRQAFPFLGKGHFLVAVSVKLHGSNNLPPDHFDEGNPLLTFTESTGFPVFSAGPKIYNIYPTYTNKEKK